MSIFQLTTSVARQTEIESQLDNAFSKLSSEITEKLDRFEERARKKHNDGKTNLVFNQMQGLVGTASATLRNRGSKWSNWMTKMKENRKDIQSQAKSLLHLDYLEQKLKSIQNNKEFSDVSIVTKTKTIPSHKIILIASSKVFEAMFRTEMKEATQNEVTIDDFDDEIVEDMLDFIYTGKVKNIQKNCVDLFRIGHKYELEELKKACEPPLVLALNLDNCVDMLVFAHLYSPERLKPQVVSYINRHKLSVLRMESFKELATTRPNLVAELYMQPCFFWNSDSVP